jgi:hypothetical protein
VAEIDERIACARCAGCGQIANTESGEPWTAWTSLPLASAAAVVAGIVRPIQCPACKGTGFQPFGWIRMNPTVCITCNYSIDGGCVHYWHAMATKREPS